MRNDLYIVYILELFDIEEQGKQIAIQVLCKHFKVMGVWGHAYFVYLGKGVQNLAKPAYIILAHSKISKSKKCKEKTMKKTIFWEVLDIEVRNTKSLFLLPSLIDWFQYLIFVKKHLNMWHYSLHLYCLCKISNSLPPGF